MGKNNLNDPLCKQFIPTKNEKYFTPGFHLDPVSDREFQQGEKLLQKYQGRALLLTTGGCAMNCRFCFRQNFPYETKRPGFNPEIATISKNTSLSEIILSGGDPLALDDLILQGLLQKLSDIPHIQRIRFHTRFPIGIPERIDDSLLSILEKCTKQIFFTLHVNHLQEMDAEIFERLKNIQKLGIPILSQTVLLKGVNDDFYTLKNLFENLANHGILPYYLHQLDPVQGAAHFAVEKKIGIALIEKLKNSLSGYAIPRYVCEIAGNPSKTEILHPIHGFNT